MAKHRSGQVGVGLRNLWNKLALQSSRNNKLKLRSETPSQNRSWEVFEDGTCHQLWALDLC